MTWRKDLKDGKDEKDGRQNGGISDLRITHPQSAIHFNPFSALRPPPSALLLVLCLLLLGVTGCARLGLGRAAEPGADTEAKQLMKALGGRSALDRIQYLHFDVVLIENGREVMRRSHLWDRKGGSYRLEWKKEGQPALALFNVKTRQGQAYQGLRMQPAADAAALLKEAYDIYKHDAWWVLGGLMVRDPGTRLEAADTQSVAGRSGPALTVRFTPETDPSPDLVCTFHLDPATHLPFAWSFVKQGGEPAPSVYLWTKFQELEKIKIPVVYEQAGLARKVQIDRLYAPKDLNKNIFTSIAEPEVLKLRKRDIPTEKELNEEILKGLRRE